MAFGGWTGPGKIGIEDGQVGDLRSAPVDIAGIVMLFPFAGDCQDGSKSITKWLSPHQWALFIYEMQLGAQISSEPSPPPGS